MQQKISCEGQRNNCIQHLPTQNGRVFLRIIYIYRTAGPLLASSTHTGRQGLSNICPHRTTGNFYPTSTLTAKMILAVVARRSPSSSSSSKGTSNMLTSWFSPGCPSAASPFTSLLQLIIFQRTCLVKRLSAVWVWKMLPPVSSVTMISQEESQKHLFAEAARRRQVRRARCAIGAKLLDFFSCWASDSSSLP